MKASLIFLAGWLMLLVNSTTLLAWQQDDPTQPQQNEVTQDGKIRFTYQDVDWQEVIPWFADQAGFTLQPVDEWPSGTFSLQDSEPYTVLEALDQLNHALRIREPAYTLVRNRKMLILAKLEDRANFPDELIETVPVDELDQRGFYEVIRTRFDLGDLDAVAIYEELQKMVRDRNREFYAVYPVSNQLFVRETGERLREMRDIIEAAKAKLEENKRDIVVYRLKFQDPETFMAAAGPQLGMPQGATTNDDGSLSITSEPLGERLFVSGTAKMLDKFKMVASLIDSDPTQNEEDIEIEKPFLRTYPVLVDKDHAFKVLQTMLEASGARMGQDEESGAITILGNTEEHALAQATLDSISGKVGEGFAMIQLKKIDAADALTVLQSLYGQNSLTEEGGSKGPTLLGDSYLGQIIVRGTVQEVADVKEIVRQLDENYEPASPGPRTGTVMIPLDESDKDRLEPMLPDILKYIGRGDNPIQIVRPEDRKDLDRKMRGGDQLDMLEDTLRENGLLREEDSIPQAQNPDERTVPSGRRRDQGNGSQLNSLIDHTSAFAALTLGPANVASAMLVQDDETDAPSNLPPNPNYIPPPQKQSVPGAPIQFRFTDYGLTIESDDLDAVDDLQQAIQDFLGEASAPQKPTFFYLKFRRVEEVKQLLEEVFGLVEAGGGGGGGGGLMGGMMNNMMGGAGDLLSGLLDTGLDGGGSGAMVLEGDVVFNMDVRFNVLMVSGATTNDLSSINQMIELFDQPEGPVDPDLQGTFRTIDVIHRDATDLVERIRSQLPELIFDPNAKAAQGGGNEMAQMMKQLQQLTGQGKGRGGNSADTEQQKAKAVLGADELTNRILVTGPDHIYQKIYDVVVELDIPDLSEPKSTKVMPRIAGGSASLQALKQQFGDRVQIEQGDGEGGSSGNNSNNPSTANRNTQDAGQDAARRAAIMNAIQQAQRARTQQGRPGGQQAGGRGGRGGGGGGNPGGGRGGGGRGGR